MRTDLFDYELPRELIATQPAAIREMSRLLVVNREAAGRFEHRRFSDLPEYLRPGDLLVVNDSRVLRARLRGSRAASGGQVELLLLERQAGHDPQSGQDRHDSWIALARPAKRMRMGESLIFGTDSIQVRARVIGEGEAGIRIIEFATPDLLPWLDQIGEIPLPPYIEQRRRERLENGEESGLPASIDDAERYQTVYARDPGSVAAPTAGLHFTPELLNELRTQGVETASVTLHVGLGTFKPVETETVEEHPMHTERFHISEDTAQAVNAARRDGRRVIAVGTTSVRSLESAAQPSGEVNSGDYDTRLMIVPGYRFKIVDALITNFHLPRSTLLMLVSALASRETIMSAYAEAIREKYRFYSYGDAMLIL